MSKTLKLLKVRQVCEKVGVSRATLDRWEAEGIFPTRVILRRDPKSGRATRVGWREDEIDDWPLTAR